MRLGGRAIGSAQGRWRRGPGGLDPGCRAVGPPSRWWRIWLGCGLVLILSSCGGTLAQVGPSPTPTPQVSPSPSPSELPSPSPSPIQYHYGELTVTPTRGPVGTVVAISGVNCHNPYEDVILAFFAPPPTLGGPVPGGAVELPYVPYDATNHFHTSFRIPAVMGNYQGFGGGPTRPGAYYFQSFPPICRAAFTVTSP